MPFSMLKNSGWGEGKFVTECLYRVANGFFLFY